MDNDGRTFSTSEIRERRRRLEQQVALQQRQLEALAKMDEAAAELEQAERDMEALSHGGSPPQQPADGTVHLDPEPQATGERSVKILKDQAGTWFEPREIMAEMDRRGWLNTDPHLAIGRLRHSLRRLADNNPRVERDQSGATYRYRWRTDTEDRALTPVPHANGTAYPALQGGGAVTG
jgi:hypothetical protein